MLLSLWAAIVAYKATVVFVAFVLGIVCIGAGTLLLHRDWRHVGLVFVMLGAIALAVSAGLTQA